MSFILDALKKSENDRQRQNGPALFEVRVAPPRSRIPLWAVGVAGLIAINLSVIGYLMLRKPEAAAAPSTEIAAAPAASQAPVAAAPPPVQAPAQITAPPPGYSYPPQAAQGAPPPASYPQQQAPAGYPQQQLPPPAYQQLPPQAPQAAYGAQGADPALSNERPLPADLNPDDYAPANASTSTGTFGGHVTRGLQSGLPTYEEASSKATIPPLHLDLHVYDPDPRKRFVLVNMKRMYEGDSLADGVKVDAISPEGAVLSFRGTRFVLERD